MNVESLKKLLDTCFLAKRIVETLPELPEGMKPRHIHVLDAIYEAQTRQGMCRVSDVSTRLNITMPSITRLIQELERMEMLEKHTDQNDKRVTLLSLTDSGLECVRHHVLEFHGAWAEELEDVSEEQAEEVSYIIERLMTTMPGKKEGERYGK